MLIRCLWTPIKLADTVLITIPNYISVLACFVCVLQRKRFVVRLAGDFREVIENSFRNQGLHFLGRIAGFMHRLLMRVQVLASGLAIANGKQLAENYGRGCRHVICCTSSTYKLTDIATSIAGSGCDELRLLYVGRLIFNKGLFELFEAARELLSEGLHFRIVIAGDGSRREEIKAKAEELGITDKVDFPGWIAIEKLKDIYCSCDIFVFPSYTEGMAKAVTEAMSNGLPVIATRVGGLPTVVEDGQTGILVPPKDVTALRDALRKVIIDGELRRDMATAGLKRSCDFTIEAERECVRSALVSHGFLKVHPNTS
jgi:glycosyltransferase involved in cell wall biosynthesis